jgi:Integral membrane protein TerC family
VDSIPAIFGVTLDPVIIYTSNMAAILSLRALYSFVATVISELRCDAVGRPTAAEQLLSFWLCNLVWVSEAALMLTVQRNSGEGHWRDKGTRHANVSNCRRFLDKAVAVVLAFIAGKMILDQVPGGVHVPTTVSLAVVAMSLSIGTAASLLLPAPEVDETS